MGREDGLEENKIVVGISSIGITMKFYGIGGIVVYMSK